MFKRALTAAAVLVLSVPAVASNMLFLGDSIFADLSEADTLAIKQSVRQALDTSPDQSRTVWSNEKEDIKVAITPKLSYKIDGRECRRTELRFKSKRRPNERYVFELCREANGWAFSPSPIKSFTSKDVEKFTQYLQDTLSTGVDGVPATWINPETGNSAVIVPIRTVSADGKTCRETAVSVIDYKKRTADGHYTFCHKADGQWERSTTP